MTRDSVPVPVK